MEHGAWSMEHGAWSMEHGACASRGSASRPLSKPWPRQDRGEAGGEGKRHCQDASSLRTITGVSAWIAAFRGRELYQDPCPGPEGMRPSRRPAVSRHPRRRSMRAAPSVTEDRRHGVLGKIIRSPKLAGQGPIMTGLGRRSLLRNRTVKRQSWRLHDACAWARLCDGESFNLSFKSLFCAEIQVSDSGQGTAASGRMMVSCGHIAAVRKSGASPALRRGFAGPEAMASGGCSSRPAAVARTLTAAFQVNLPDPGARTRRPVSTPCAGFQANPCNKMIMLKPCPHSGH